MCKYSFWTFSSFSRQLENYYPGQLGSSDSCRLQNFLCGSTSPVATKSHYNQVQHSDKAPEHRYPDASNEGSNQGISATQEPIYFLDISSRESPIPGRMPTIYQPETPKQICRRVVIQDGGSSSSSFVDTTERLYDETRSQGRLLFGPDPPRLSQISTLCVQREDIPVSMSPLWFEISPSCLHQANHSPYQELGNTDCHLRRRHSRRTQVSQYSTIYLQEDCEPARGVGVPHQPEQMFVTPFPTTDFLGNNAQHCHNVPVLARRKAGSHPTGSTPATYQGHMHTTGVGCTPGTHEPCSSEWHLASSSALPSSTEGWFSWHRKIGLQEFETVPRPVTGGCERPGVVADLEHPEHQCSTPQIPTCIRSGHSHRCIPDSDTYSRYTQCRCRHSFSSIQPRGGMDIGPQHISKDSGPPLSSGCRSLCAQGYPTRWRGMFPDIQIQEQ